MRRMLGIGLALVLGAAVPAAAHPGCQEAKLPALGSNVYIGVCPEGWEPRRPTYQGPVWIGVAGDLEEPGQVYVWQVYRDTPAERAGIRPGDRLLAVETYAGGLFTVPDGQKYVSREEADVFVVVAKKIDSMDRWTLQRVRVSYIPMPDEWWKLPMAAEKRTPFGWRPQGLRPF